MSQSLTQLGALRTGSRSQYGKVTDDIRNKVPQYEDIFGQPSADASALKLEFASHLRLQRNCHRCHSYERYADDARQSNLLFLTALEA